MLNACDGPFSPVGVLPVCSVSTAAMDSKVVGRELWKVIRPAADDLAENTKQEMMTRGPKIHSHLGQRRSTVPISMSTERLWA